MPRKTEVSDKQIYALWWEYLKRSEKYKRLWNCRRTGKEKDRREANKLEDGFREEVLVFFGDIHNCSFEKWWADDPLSKKENTVEDYFSQLPEEMNYVVEEWKRKRKSGGKQSLQEHMNLCFSDRVLSHKQICLLITFGEPTNIDDVLEKIKRRLNDERKKLINEDEFHESPLPLYPTQPIRFGEIDRYLKVYDLKNQQKPKLKNREIAKIVYSNRQWTGNLERALLIDFRKAKDIIDNVERGVFPGEY